ncbi:hypothetical protein A3F66_02890 [candidate division TM6 bacterium RIFCSPHIGHO2_12_FULL_32_22]|nr:MAG: hypothetical protein A3F66_02890 [candidate division TM6 bacterium RIFCSPHIGHO2_12_FULL_32_22]
MSKKLLSIVFINSLLLSNTPRVILRTLSTLKPRLFRYTIAQKFPDKIERFAVESCFDQNFYSDYSCAWGDKVVFSLFHLEINKVVCRKIRENKKIYIPEIAASVTEQLKKSHKGQEHHFDIDRELIECLVCDVVKWYKKA